MKSILYTIQDVILKYYSYIVNVILFLTLIGIGVAVPEYLKTFQYYLKIYLAVFLIYRFNSFRTIKFTELDRKVAFSSGLLLLSTTILGEFLVKYADFIATNVTTNLNTIF